MGGAGETTTSNAQRKNRTDKEKNSSKLGSVRVGYINVSIRLLWVYKSRKQNNRVHNNGCVYMG